MPRPKYIRNQKEFMGHSIKEKYTYDKSQLRQIIEAMDYYHAESKKDTVSDYVVFDVTLRVKDTRLSPYYEPLDYDDCSGEFFDVNSMKEVFPDDYFFYRWTREWSEKNQEHYHFMVIANHVPKQGYLQQLHQNILELTGVKTAFISPRLLADDDHRGKLHFHWLNKEPDDADGLNDAVNRHSYKSKMDQKLKGVKRTFDGCRVLKPLLPLSKRLHSLSVAAEKKQTAVGA